MSLRHVLICASVVLVFGAGFASSYAENSSTNHTIAGGRTLAAPITVVPDHQREWNRELLRLGADETFVFLRALPRRRYEMI